MLATANCFSQYSLVILEPQRINSLLLKSVFPRLLVYRSLLTGCLVIFGLGKIWKESFYFAETWTTFEAVVYRCFSKTGWSLALSWIVFSCHHGYGGEKRCRICILYVFFHGLIFRNYQQFSVMGCLCTLVKIDFCSLPKSFDH